MAAIAPCLNGVREEFSLDVAATAELKALIGRPPDPVGDGAALKALTDPDDPSVRQFAKLLGARYADWRLTALRDLLPGLDLVESDPSCAPLSARASNRLAFGGVETWSALAQMTPHRIACLPHVGRQTLEEILLFALANWAAAYLSRADHATELPHEAARIGRLSPGQASGGEAERFPTPSLLGRPPDRGRDRWVLLSLADPADPAASRLARQILACEPWTRAALDDLLPGLAAVDSRPFFDRLSVRAANCLIRAGVRTLDSLAALSPVELGDVPELGRRTLEEILSALIAHWALASMDGEELASIANGQGEPGREAGQAREEAASLASAFEQLEATPGFSTFKGRRLQGTPGQSFASLAAQQGVSIERARQLDARIAALLERSMRATGWPLRDAVDALRARLGSVARPSELEAAFAGLDQDRSILEEAPHRRALLLWLGRYRVEEEWVLGPDIEALTAVILNAVADSGERTLDRALRQLALLGVRESVQLPWIVSRFGFRVIDGELVST